MVSVASGLYQLVACLQEVSVRVSALMYVPRPFNRVIKGRKKRLGKHVSGYRISGELVRTPVPSSMPCTKGLYMERVVVMMMTPVVSQPRIVGILRLIFAVMIKDGGGHTA